MEKQIKFNDISLIGMELFRKNNDTFMRSKLSPIMGRLFTAANKDSGIRDYENEYYMKSGILPNKVFYVYSDQLTEKNPTKIFDVVNFNGEICIWFYSNNVINMIEEEPANTISSLYAVLISIFRKSEHGTFVNEENLIVHYTMVIKFIQFLYDTYGLSYLENYKYHASNFILTEYTKESIMDFIDDVLDNYDDKSYYDSRKYLDSYLLLELKNQEDSKNTLDEEEQLFDDILCHPAVYEGHNVWYTDDRVKLPLNSNLYKYELRYSDEADGEPVEIADHILADFYGTIISTEPIDLPLSSLVSGIKYNNIDTETPNFSINGAADKIISLLDIIEQVKKCE